MSFCVWFLSHTQRVRPAIFHRPFSPPPSSPPSVISSAPPSSLHASVDRSCRRDRKKESFPFFSTRVHTPQNPPPVARNLCINSYLGFPASCDAVETKIFSYQVRQPQIQLQILSFKEMFGTLTQRREVSSGFSFQRPSWRTIINNGRRNSNATNAPTTVTKKIPYFSVKFQDIYGFTVEGSLDDVNVLNEVSERVRRQARAWWALEASKGANWYLEPWVSSISEGIFMGSLKLSVLANTISLRKLIRKGIPPLLRPKVWLSVSGATKKRSTAPESYYDDLISATEFRVTPATLQIDHLGNCCKNGERTYLAAET
ncbi:hypothetical protein Taro_035560 [Colocasia esculenta]|uniref:Uncharacterized protein n=1 Tax=Colocasia esculenta TaxID=4460 RepID=A0A843VUT3_COLES|nr:hypothetical protein [Colocasia esculenta]